VAAIAASGANTSRAKNAVAAIPTATAMVMRLKAIMENSVMENSVMENLVMENLVMENLVMATVSPKSGDSTKALKGVRRMPDHSA
jgi:hypothetical protein